MRWNRAREDTRFFSRDAILFFFFPSSPLDRSLRQKKTKRTQRNDKLCRFRVGSDNFWDSRIASTRQGEGGLIMPRGTKQRCSPLRNNFVPRERTRLGDATATDKSVLAREKLQTFQSRTSPSASVIYWIK